MKIALHIELIAFSLNWKLRVLIRGSANILKESATMEEILKSILHLGVGVGKTIEDGFQVSSSDPQGILFELISIGENADDESVNMLRGYIEDVSNMANEYEIKAKEVFEGLVTAVQNIDTGNLVEDINQKVADIMSGMNGNSSTRV